MDELKIITDDTYREVSIHGNESYPFAYYFEDIWDFDFHTVSWHWHSEFEFIYVNEGTATCLVGTEKIDLHKGCGLFVNSGILHRYEAQVSTIVPNIVFSPSLIAPESSLVYNKFILPVIKSGISYVIFEQGIDWQEQVLTLLKEIFSAQERKENEFHTVRLITHLWDILSANLKLPDIAPTSKHSNLEQGRLQTMMQFIHSRYAEKITLEEIAASAFISKGSALLIFKTYINTSPIAYLIEYRLSKAAELLRKTEKTVTEISEETGFGSAGYFCRKFRERFHLSPNEYRQLKR